VQIGFIGLGNMGASIARDLARSEHELTVYDLREDVLSEFAKLGAHIAASPAEVAARSEVVGICVRTDEQLLSVLRGEQGVLAGAKPGLVIAVHSTIHLRTLEVARAEAAGKQVRLVDAPVTRGVNAPKERAIVFMIGGAPEDVAKVVAYATPAALKIVETGKLGSALTLKICNNIITWLMTVTLRDALRLADAAGIHPSKLAELVSCNGVAGPNMLYAISRWSRDSSNVHHVIDTAEVNAELGEKDLSCALERAASLGVELPAVVFGRTKIRQAVLEMLK
jgi:3-hydroxyisobutyrate dehydrogenase